MFATCVATYIKLDDAQTTRWRLGHPPSRRVTLPSVAEDERVLESAIHSDVDAGDLPASATRQLDFRRWSPKVASLSSWNRCGARCFNPWVEK